LNDLRTTAQQLRCNQTVLASAKAKNHNQEIRVEKDYLQQMRIMLSRKEQKHVDFIWEIYRY
jgi:hypothetical protein